MLYKGAIQVIIKSVTIQVEVQVEVMIEDKKASYYII